MNRITPKSILFFSFIFLSQLLPARESFSTRNDSSATSSFFIEAQYGVGVVNNRFTPQGTYLNIGYRHAIMTARFCRSLGDYTHGYIFENAFLMGYRFTPYHGFTTTLSVGNSDVGFEQGYHSYFELNPAHYVKTIGICFEAEQEWMIPSHGKSSPWSVTAMYYSTFNSLNNLNGFLLGLKFCPMRIPGFSLFAHRAAEKHPLFSRLRKN